MEAAFRRAIQNLIHHGDTDIFPFPVENRIIQDEEKEFVKLLTHVNSDFDVYLATYPPANYGALAPVGYTGFRWATQIDPVWNIYFLGLVVELGEKIEAARLGSDIIFSYRFNPDPTSPDLWKREFGWRSFTERAISLAGAHKFVISCDISEFYPRLNHHRLDNALRQLPKADTCRNKIMAFLSNFSGTYSFGLPVGGPASRLLSELTLNQIDRLIYQQGVPFCRFADDFYLFAQTESDAFKVLVYLSEILNRNQGLQLQKAKTRIMSAAEFLSTNPLTLDPQDDTPSTGISAARQSLLRISLHFDPYSPTAAEDYERLSSEIRRFPILDILKAELSKSRVNISLTRKLIGTLQFIEKSQLDDAVRTLVDNPLLLYPVFFNVMSAIAGVFENLSESGQDYAVGAVRSLIDHSSPVVSVDLNLQYAVRLLARKRSEETVALFTRLHDATNSSAIRRDIIIAMARWREWIWLSDRKGYFRSMRPDERRAFILASYSLKDEGKHWREHTKEEFSPFEVIVRDWIASRVQRSAWEIPL